MGPGPGHAWHDGDVLAPLAALFTVLSALTVPPPSPVPAHSPAPAPSRPTAPPNGVKATPTPPAIPSLDTARLDLSGTTVTLAAGRLTARESRTSKLLWSRPAPAGRSALLAGAGDTVLVAVEGARPWTLAYAVHRLRTGELVARASLDAGLMSLDARGGVYLLAVATTGGETHVSTLVLDARTGDRAADVSGVLVGENKDALLFDDTGGVFNPHEAVILRFHAVSLRGLKAREIAWSVPARPTCGPVERREDASGEWVTERFVEAARRDRCGAFVARFDWTRPELPPTLESER